MVIVPNQRKMSVELAEAAGFSKEIGLEHLDTAERLLMAESSVRFQTDYCLNAVDYHIDEAKACFRDRDALHEVLDLELWGYPVHLTNDAGSNTNAYINWGEDVIYLNSDYFGRYARGRVSQKKMQRTLRHEGNHLNTQFKDWKSAPSWSPLHAQYLKKYVGGALMDGSPDSVGYWLEGYNELLTHDQTAEFNYDCAYTFDEVYATLKLEILAEEVLGYPLMAFYEAGDMDGMATAVWRMTSALILHERIRRNLGDTDIVEEIQDRLWGVHRNTLNFTSVSEADRFVEQTAREIELERARAEFDLATAPAANTLPV